MSQVTVIAPGAVGEAATPVTCEAAVVTEEEEDAGDSPPSLVAVTA